LARLKQLLDCEAFCAKTADAVNVSTTVSKMFFMV